MTVTIDDIYIADGGYYINLDSRPDRKYRVEQQLKHFNINGVKRMPAIIKGEYAGCGESHKEIIKKAIKYKMDSVLIFEDDFFIMDPPNTGFQEYNTSFKDMFKVVLNQARTVHWDALFFGAILHAPLIKISPNLGRIQAAKSAHCFIIKHTLYDSILNWSYEKYDQIDHYFYTNLQKTHTFLTSYPILINHGSPEPELSDLLKQHTTYHYYLLSTYQEFCKDFQNE